LRGLGELESGDVFGTDGRADSGHDGNEQDLPHLENLLLKMPNL
jgi:hypothetical protein